MHGLIKVVFVLQVMHVIKQSCKHTMDRWKFRRLEIFQKYSRVPSARENPPEVVMVTPEPLSTPIETVKTPRLAHISSEFSDSQVC